MLSGAVALVTGESGARRAGARELGWQQATAAYGAAPGPVVVRATPSPPPARAAPSAA